MKDRSNRVWLPLAAWGMLLVPAAAQPALALPLPGARTRPSSLPTSTDQSMEGAWAVIRAEVLEGDSSRLTVRNISQSTIEEARFYAEYFDAGGRLCATLTFATGANPRPQGPLPPGAQRDLYSSSTSILAISRPVEVRVSLIGQRPVGQPAAVMAAGGAMHGPVEARPPTTAYWQRLTMDPALLALLEGGRSTVDLVLADVFVDASGTPVRSTIVDAASPGLRSWFPQFLQQFRFYPASIGLTPVAGETLMLVRAFSGKVVEADVTAMAASRSPWVQAFAAGYTGGDVLPQVIDVPFYPSESAGAAPNVFEDRLASAEWGGPPWEVDPTSHKIARRWVTPEGLPAANK